MAMSKKDFIALANMIKTHNRLTKHNGEAVFTEGQLESLAIVCRNSNPNFNEDRWLAYIADECGPNGGAR